MRYIVFAYNYYYPGGGSNDVKAVTSTREKARREAAKLVVNEDRRYDVVELFDCQDGTYFRVTASDVEVWTENDVLL